MEKWYELSNEDILKLKEDWKAGNPDMAGKRWEDIWEERLYWHTKIKDKKRNYKRNNDVIYNQSTRSYIEEDVNSSLSKYRPGFSVNNNNLIMNWDE